MLVRPLMWFTTLIVFGMALAGEDNSMIQGVVQGPFGRPVANARVTLYSSGQVLMTKSGSSGEFLFNSLPQESYGLEVTANGLQDKTVEHAETLTANGRPLIITMNFSNQPYHCGYLPVSYENASDEETGVVTGEVSGDTPPGKPDSAIPDATVRLFKSDNPVAISSVRTNKAGQFQFRNLAPGRYSIKVSNKVYMDEESQGFWVGRDFHTEITVSMMSKKMFKKGARIICQ